MTPALSYVQASDYDFDRYAFKTEAFATIGSGSWYSNTSGLMMGGGVVLKPYPRAGFEITYRYLDAEQQYATTWHYRESGYTLTASVHYYFTQLRVQPYLLLSWWLMRSQPGRKRSGR